MEDLKPSRDGKPGDYMLRLQEIAGKPTTVALRTAFSISSVDATTMNENQVLLRGLHADVLQLAPTKPLPCGLPSLVPTIHFKEQSIDLYLEEDVSFSSDRHRHVRVVSQSCT
jgi:hypothetical protein